MPGSCDESARGSQTSRTVRVGLWCARCHRPPQGDHENDCAHREVGSYRAASSFLEVCGRHETTQWRGLHLAISRIGIVRVVLPFVNPASSRAKPDITCLRVATRLIVQTLVKSPPFNGANWSVTSQRRAACARWCAAWGVA